MTRLFYRSFGCLGVLAATLTACGESQQQISAARSMSCTELAHQIGRRAQRKDTAQAEGWINLAEGVFASDKEAALEASVEHSVSAFEEADAEMSLNQLQEIYREKRCR